jgi:surface antigen
VAPEDAARPPQRQTPYRALTHAAVLGAALVPMSFTVANAQTNPVRDERITIPLALDAATYRDAYVLSPLRAAAAADALAPANPAAAIADGTPQPPAPAPRPSPTAQPVAGAGGRFPWGYCTWYVSTKRYVPWSGNAIDWWPNARGMGFPEGTTARVGAIMVTRESYVGHVAYVESVDPNGGYTISEMNFQGFGIVDQRHFASNPSFLVGFIY